MNTRNSKTEAANQAPSRGAVSAPLTSRLFFAIRPDEQATQEILVVANALRQQHALEGKILDAARLHVTLLWLGDFPNVPEQSLAAIEAASSTVSEPAFEATFDRALSFPPSIPGRSRSRREAPLVLAGDAGVARIVELHRVLTTAIASIPANIFSLKAAKTDFTPHITLLYDRHVIAPQAVRAVTFNVNEFALLHSHVGQNRPYEILAQWPLRSI